VDDQPAYWPRKEKTMKLAATIAYFLALVALAAYSASIAGLTFHADIPIEVKWICHATPLLLVLEIGRLLYTTSRTY